MTSHSSKPVPERLHCSLVCMWTKLSCLSCFLFPTLMKAGLTKSLYIAAMRLGSLKMLLQTQQWHRAQSVIYRLLTAYHQQANGLYEGYYQMLSNTRLKFAQKIVGLGMRSFKTLCIAIKMLHESSKYNHAIWGYVCQVEKHIVQLWSRREEYLTRVHPLDGKREAKGQRMWSSKHADSIARRFWIERESWETGLPLHRRGLYRPQPNCSAVKEPTL